MSRLLQFFISVLALIINLGCSDELLDREYACEAVGHPLAFSTTDTNAAVKVEVYGECSQDDSLFVWGDGKPEVINTRDSKFRFKAINDKVGDVEVTVTFDWRYGPLMLYEQNSATTYVGGTMLSGDDEITFTVHGKEYYSAGGSNININTFVLEPVF